MLDNLQRDLAYAARSLWRSPGFTVAAVLTLSIGIGATTAIYSVVDTVLLQPLPFPDSDRLVRVIENYPVPVLSRVMQRGLTYPEYLDWRGHARTLSDSTAVIPMAQRLVKTSNGAAGLWGAMASSNTFALLRTSAMLGRTLGDGDEANPDVVVLGYDTWRSHFNSDPAIVGRAIEMTAGALQLQAPARLLTVVGVLPRDFEFPTGPLDFYIPVSLDPSKRPPQVTMIGRLSPGASLDAAVQEMNVMGDAIRPPWPATGPALVSTRIEVQPLKDQVVRTLRPALRILLAAVIVVSLVVCANVANLLLARGTSRRREIAVRLAVGASRGRIVRLVLAECIVLALAGGVFGAMLGAGGVLLVKQLAMVDAPGIFRLMFGSSILPRGHEVGINVRVFGIAFTIAVITSVVFGLLPALHLSRTDGLLAVGSRRPNSRGESRLRSTLVVAQLVMATMLLVAAGLLTNSFIKLSAADRGYDPNHVLAFNLLFPDKYSVPLKAETVDILLARLRQMPDVTSAGFARHGLLIGESLTLGTFVPPGRTLAEMEQRRSQVRAVSQGFLTAMGVPVIEGREFAPSDTETAPPMIVLNRSAARRYFGDASPVGQIVDWHMGKNQTQVTVAGVVEDLHQQSAAAEVVPEIFVDYRQFLALEEKWGEGEQRKNEFIIGFLSFAVRTTGDPAQAIPRVRDLLTAVDPNIGVDAMTPMTSLVASSVARERFYAVMLGVFAGVGGLLAAIGIYAVLAYAVVQRTQEIGIRMALGAERSQVMGLVLGKGLLLTGIGLALGLAGAAMASRALQGLLFGLTPLDVTTYLSVALTFALVAACASYLPARRATKVDPVIALRAE